VTASIWLDIICAIFLGYCIISAYTKGFVRTILSFVSVIASFILAKMLANNYASLVSEKFVNPAVTGLISEKLKDAAGSADTYGKIGNIFQSIGDKVRGTIESSLFSSGQIINENSIASVSDWLTNVGLFFLFFILLMILFKMIIFCIDLIFKLPVLKSVNHLFGFAFGFLQGVLYIAIFCILLSLFITNASEKSLVQREDINNTYLLKQVYNSEWISSYLFVK